MVAFVNGGAVNDKASAIVVEGEGCVASCFEHGDFTGWQADFKEGSYDLKGFKGQGAKNDDMSSIKVWVYGG